MIPSTVERIFKSWIVREVKGKATPTPFEKSRLVIQACNDYGKLFSPNRLQSNVQVRDLLLLLHEAWDNPLDSGYYPSLYPINNTSSKKDLGVSPKEIEELYPKGTIMILLKPLYGIAEAGTH